MSLTRFEFTNRVRPVMEVGIGSTVIDESAALWDVSLWDAPSSTWNGDEPLWRDVSCDVIDAHIELGRGRITDAFPVGTAQVTVDNNSGWADPSIDQEDSTVGHLSFPGTAGNYITVDDYAALGITGDISIMFRFRTSEWPPPYLTGWIAGVQFCWNLFIQSDETLQLITAPPTTITASPTITPSTDWRWFYVALDVNNGAGGHDSKWWYGGNGDLPGAWVEYGSDTAAGVLAITNNTEPLIIGTAIDGGFTGEISHLSVRSGFGPSLTVGGTVVFEFNGWDLTDDDVTSSSITPRVGDNPMVVNGDDVGIVAAIQPDATHLRLRPGRAIRIGVVHDTIGTRWLYRGFIDAILPKDDVEDWSTVTMDCIDALGEAGRAKLASGEGETGAGEQARTRFARILDTITWPSTKRSISTSAIRPLYAAELDGQVVDLLRQTAESEGGWCFADTEGDIVLQHRDWLYHVVGDPTDATIGNLTGAALELLLENGLDLLLEQSDEILLELSGSDVCPTRWVRAFDRRDITTRVILDRDWPSTVETPGPAIIVNDVQGQTLYGIEPFERLDLWTQNTSDVQQNAGRIIATRAARVSMPRVREVTIDAAAGADADKRDAAIDLLTELSIFTPSRYRGRFQTDRGVVFDSNFFAVGVVHDLSSEGWSADISLDRSFPFERLDPGDYIWDTARWDRSLWN